MHNQKVARRLRAQHALAVALALILSFTALSSAAEAAKWGNGTGKKAPTGSSSLSLVLLDSTDGLPHWGQNVTFTVSTTATSYPYVSLVCYQAGTLVLSGSAGFFPSYPFPQEQVMSLSSMRWTGGASDCTATLFSQDGAIRTLVTLSFHVYE